MTVEEEIGALKQKHGALILAHNYTRPEVQELADYVGDSLELARKAAECHAPVIVFCGVRFMAETAKILSPESVVLHPECTPAVVALADHALSTGGMLKFVRGSKAKEFIIGTECGIIHRMRKENPDKNFYPLEPAVLCPNMKKITPENVLFALRDLSPRIEIDEAVRLKAKAPIDKMLEVLP